MRSRHSNRTKNNGAAMALFHSAKATKNLLTWDFVERSTFDQYASMVEQAGNINARDDQDDTPLHLTDLGRAVTKTYESAVDEGQGERLLSELLAPGSNEQRSADHSNE